jgi:hypothetical protein
MAIDQSKIGTVAAQLMEQLEDAYGDEASIDTVMIIVAVDRGEGSEDVVHRAASPGTPAHVGIGLLTVVLDSIRPR